MAKAPRKNPTVKPAKVYGISVGQKSGRKLYLQEFTGHDTVIRSPVFTDDVSRALVFDQVTAKGAAWALGKVLYKHTFSVVELKK